jgi:hypothetical protein
VLRRGRVRCSAAEGSLDSAVPRGAGRRRAHRRDVDAGADGAVSARVPQEVGAACSGQGALAVAQRSGHVLDDEALRPRDELVAVLPETAGERLAALPANIFSRWVSNAAAGRPFPAGRAFSHARTLVQPLLVEVPSDHLRRDFDLCPGGWVSVSLGLFERPDAGGNDDHWQVREVTCRSGVRQGGVRLAR